MWYVWVTCHVNRSYFSGTWQNEFFLNLIGVSHDSCDLCESWLMWSVWVMTHVIWSFITANESYIKSYVNGTKQNEFFLEWIGVSHDSCDLCEYQLLWCVWVPCRVNGSYFRGTWQNEIFLNLIQNEFFLEWIEVSHDSCDMCESQFFVTESCLGVQLAVTHPMRCGVGFIFGALFVAACTAWVS